MRDEGRCRSHIFLGFAATSPQSISDMASEGTSIDRVSQCSSGSMNPVAPFSLLLLSFICLSRRNEVVRCGNDRSGPGDGVRRRKVRLKLAAVKQL